MWLITSFKRSTWFKVGLVMCLAVVICAVVLVITLTVHKVATENIVDYYENLILIETENALLYTFPEDARQFEADNDTVIDFGTYDFIIIGAGSAGAVIANRLSEVEQWQILLLEAGTYPNNVTEIPGIYVLACFSDYNWGLKSVPQTTACLGTMGQKCVFPAGKGLGGTTLLNGLVYGRGHPQDYERWANVANDSSWTYENVLQFFKKSENFHQTDPEAPVDMLYHGVDGYWSVEHHQPPIQLKQVFLEANKELGYNYTDYNGPEQFGGTTVQYNTNFGKRHDQATAFILPVLYRTNLHVQAESFVTKIEIDSATKQATGVIFTYQGQTYRADATKEVILSAGVTSSPKILMLSGVGPQQHLEDLGIPVIQNLSVGATLRDHVGVYGLQFSSNMINPLMTLKQSIIAFLNGTGPLSSNTKSHVIGWYKSSAEPIPNYPDLELVIDLSSENSNLGQRFLNWNDETWNTLWGEYDSSFYLAMINLRPRSVGSITLNSSNPFEFPLINYNLLSDPDNLDIDTLYEGINFVMELVNTTAFREIDAKFESRPLPACSNFEYLSKDYWYCYIRQVSLPVFHSVGSCPVGTDPQQGAVVDSDLKVFGIGNLRVADASVFPFTLASHPSADCAMIGEKISDVIKLNYSVV